MKPNENITIHKRIMHMLYVIHYIMSNDDMTEFTFSIPDSAARIVNIMK